MRNTKKLTSIAIVFAMVLSMFTLVLSVSADEAKLASADIGGITFEAKTAGVAGNNITVAFVDPSSNDASLSLGGSGNDIIVNLETDNTGAITSTLNDIVTAFSSHLLVTAKVAASSQGTDTAGAVSATNLTGGADATTTPDPDPNPGKSIKPDVEVYYEHETISAVSSGDYMYAISKDMDKDLADANISKIKWYPVYTGNYGIDISKYIPKKEGTKKTGFLIKYSDDINPTKATIKEVLIAARPSAKTLIPKTNVSYDGEILTVTGDKTYQIQVGLGEWLDMVDNSDGSKAATESTFTLHNTLFPVGSTLNIRVAAVETTYKQVGDDAYVVDKEGTFASDIFKSKVPAIAKAPAIKYTEAVAGKAAKLGTKATGQEIALITDEMYVYNKVAIDAKDITPYEVAGLVLKFYNSKEYKNKADEGITILDIVTNDVIAIPTITLGDLFSEMGIGSAKSDSKLTADDLYLIPIRTATTSAKPASAITYVKVPMADFVPAPTATATVAGQVITVTLTGGTFKDATLKGADFGAKKATDVSKVELDESVKGQGKNIAKITYKDGTTPDTSIEIKTAVIIAASNKANVKANVTDATAGAKTELAKYSAPTTGLNIVGGSNAVSDLKNLINPSTALTAGYTATISVALASASTTALGDTEVLTAAKYTITVTVVETGVSANTATKTFDVTLTSAA